MTSFPLSFSSLHPTPPILMRFFSTPHRLMRFVRKKICLYSFATILQLHYCTCIRKLNWYLYFNAVIFVFDIYFCVMLGKYKLN